MDSCWAAWVAAERAHQDDPPPAADANERAELARLRMENAALRMDRELPDFALAVLKGKVLQRVLDGVHP